MDSIACFAEQNSMVKTSFRTGFPICHRHIGFKWVRIHFPDPTQKKAPPDGDAFFWWGKVDSNHRSYKQQIYSLSPLATREFPHIHITSSRGLGYHIIFSQNVKKNLRSFQRNLSRQRRTFSDILTGKKWLTSLRENATISWKLEEMEAPQGCGFSKARWLAKANHF